MTQISKVPLSGSNNGARIVLTPEFQTIHEVAPNLEYSELWLYAINRKDETVTIVIKINGSEFSIDLVAQSDGIKDLFRGCGAVVESGDKIEARCDVADASGLTGFINQAEKQNGKNEN
jgi:hypothetical protein